MRAAGVAYLLGLVGVAIDGRGEQVALFVGCFVVAAVVRHGRGRWRAMTGERKSYGG